MDRAIRRVTVAPVLPYLHLPTRSWPEGGLPRHPAGTAYNAPGAPYRFVAATQSEVAGWYREAMVDAGWRLAAQRGDDFQAWVRGKRPNDPIVILRLNLDRFFIELVLVDDGIPRHPRGVPGGARCNGSLCQLVRGLTPEQIGPWFREHLGYLGWREADSNTFQKALGEVRLEERASEGGTVIARGQAIAPPEGWPTPMPGESRSALCEATRGAEVEVAGRRVRLHPSLCVTLREPGRLRIQVAYGRSYLEMDPATGEQMAGSLSWQEVALFERLEPFTGTRLPRTTLAPAKPALPSPRPILTERPAPEP